jgi:MurNAc alpha-1-phosphate uridylyltransferase
MSIRPKTAMVLGAGLGMRMRPLTDELPKPLVKLDGRALIDHVLDRLHAAQIKRAVVNVHYKAAQLIAHLEQRSQPPIVVSDERKQLLDTGGGVKNALKLLGADPFVIHNSDSVWLEGVGSNLERLFRAWDDRTMDSLLLLAPGVTSLGYEGRGDFFLAQDGRIRRRGEREYAPFVFTGVSLAHPRLFEGSPDGAFSLNVLWNRAIEAGRVHGLRLEGIWMHVGTPEALKDAEVLIREHRN